MNMSKKLLIVPVLLIILFAFTGCSSSGVSEKQVKADLEASIIYSSLDVETTDFSIIKQQTDKDAKVDLVYVSITGENEFYSLERNYLMTYGLYNDGWVLDYIDSYQDEQNFDRSVPLVDNKEEVELFKEIGYENITSEIYDDNGFYTNKISYTITDEYAYLTETVQFNEYYYFDEEYLCWEYSNYERVVLEQDWKLNGTWHYENDSPRSDLVDSVYFDFVINSFDGDTVDLVYNQSVIYDYRSGLGMDVHEEYIASGSGVFDAIENEDLNFYIRFEDEGVEVYLVFDRDEGLLNAKYPNYTLKHIVAE